MVTARWLLAWGDREQRRRRAARRGLARLGPGGWSMVAAAVLGLELARRLAAGLPAGAHALWIAVAVVGFAVVVFGAPFRMYWRHDCGFIGRLAIDGETLFRLAMMRSARAAAWTLLVCAVGAGVLGSALGVEVGLRHLTLAVVAAAASAAVGPSVALFAGALIASDRAMALVDAVAGAEIGAPKTTWLGMLPGIAATAVGAALLAGARWAAGASMTAIGRPLVVFAVVLGVSSVILIVAWRIAGGVMLAAVREVAALDRVRLAHVERSTASALERLWASVTLSESGRRVFAKDAALARRRYPAPYFLAALGVLALWIVAVVAPGDLEAWAGGLLGALAVYAVVMARRLATPPVEHPAYLATLAVSARTVGAAKVSAVVLRVAVTLVLGAVPVVARADNPVRVGAGVAVVLVAATTVAIAAAAVKRT